MNQISEPLQLTLSPAPRAGLVGGHIWEFNHDPLGFLTRCAREFGDAVPLRFGPFDVYLVSHPDAIQDILVTRNRLFRKGRGLERTRLILGNGLLTSEGDFWRRQRRLAQPAFHNQRIQAYGRWMSQYTQEMLASWRSRPAGEVRDVHQDMMALTLAIVARSLFDVDLRSSKDEVRTAIEAAMEEFVRLSNIIQLPEWLPTPSRRRFLRAARQLEKVVYAIIDSRDHDPTDHGDLLSMLLQARDEDGAPMPRQQLRDEVMTLLLAGHETTANTLAFSWMLLSQNPLAEERLHAELDSVLAGRMPGIDDLPRLPYTAQVVQEALRLYPPAWVINRQPLENVEVCGIPISSETGILISQWVIQRDPRYFAEPERFLPERWTPEFTRDLPDFAYFPFGGGPRLCIGKSFALQEAALVLATVAQGWQLRLVDSRPVELEASITLRPRHGIPMQVVSRHA